MPNWCRHTASSVVVTPKVVVAVHLRPSVTLQLLHLEAVIALLAALPPLFFSLLFNVT